MAKNYSANAVTITQGFPGTYSLGPGSQRSFYLNGDPKQGEIHFTLPVDQGQFSAFHISRSVDGSNVGIWYQEQGAGIRFSNINYNNLPTHKRQEFDTWYREHAASCLSAAQEFWNAFP